MVTLMMFACESSIWYVTFGPGPGFGSTHDFTSRVPSYGGASGVSAREVCGNRYAMGLVLDMNCKSPCLRFPASVCPIVFPGDARFAPPSCRRIAADGFYLGRDRN